MREEIGWMGWDGRVLGMLRWAGKSGCGGGFGVENTRGNQFQLELLDRHQKKKSFFWSGGGGVSRNGYGFKDF